MRPKIKKILNIYTYEEILVIVKDLIKENELIYVSEVRDLVPCSNAEFNRHFKNKERMRQLLSLLSECKSKAKAEIRKRWKTSKAPALQLAYYKLHSTDEERRLLSTTYTENDNNNKFDGKVEVVMYNGGDIPPIATDEQEVRDREGSDIRIISE